MRNNTNAPRRGEYTPVTIISSDDISSLSDDELSNKFSAVKRRIDQGRKKNLDPKVVRGLEVEYCYLHREIGIRNNRRDAHVNFVKSKKSRKYR